jgi:cell division protein ZipA
MTLPGPKDYSKAFEYMLETAQCFARNLKGELKDENLSVMTAQTIEHSRQRIKEFKRLELSKNRYTS